MPFSALVSSSALGAKPPLVTMASKRRVSLLSACLSSLGLGHVRLAHGAVGPPASLLCPDSSGSASPQGLGTCVGLCLGDHTAGSCSPSGGFSKVTFSRASCLTGAFSYSSTLASVLGLCVQGPPPPSAPSPTLTPRPHASVSLTKVA